MYRCMSKACDENVDFILSSHQDIILHGREKEFPFHPRILLSCGHSICELCIYNAVTSKKEEFVKCDECGKTTSFSRQTLSTITSNRPRTKESVRWNQDGEDDLLYEAFSIGAAFNSGRVSVSATPIVDLDENTQETSNLPSHAYRNEPEVFGMRDKVSNASEIFKSFVAEGISMYVTCGKSLKFIFDTKNTLNKQFVETKEAIRKRFHVLHGLLQLEEANLIKELINNKDSAVRHLNEKEKTIDATRQQLKGLIMRSPQFAHIQTNNPFKKDIDQFKGKPLRLEVAPEFPNNLPQTKRAHDDLHKEIKKLADFRQTVRFDVTAAFTPLLSSNQPAPTIPSTPEDSRGRKQVPPRPLAYINYIDHQIVTIHDVKDSGYFTAHLPGDEALIANLNNKISKHCNIYRHSPCISQLKPSTDLLVWYDQKHWARAKFKCVGDSIEQEVDKENYLLFSSDLTPKKVEVFLVDYGGEVYETRIENIRESNPEIANEETFPPLRNKWKCQLKNIQPINNNTQNLRSFVHKFCPSETKVRLLVLSGPVDGVYEVDVAHVIGDLENPQATLIEFLIFSKVAILRNPPDPNVKYPYPSAPPVRQYSEPKMLSTDMTYSVDVTSIRSPHSFSVVVSRERGEIDSLEDKIDSLYSTPGFAISLRLYFPREYVPCAAKCELFWDRKKERGKRFHRGYIIFADKLPPGCAVFLAVDYGESVIVPLTDIRVLPDCFVRALYRTAISCSIDDIVPRGSDKWGQNAITAFTELFEPRETPTTLRVKNRVENGRYNVELSFHKLGSLQSGGNIGDVLVKDGFAVKKADAPEVIDIANNPLSTGPYARNGNNRVDFNCFSLLQDMVKKLKSQNTGPVSSLIPVRLTAFHSPVSFYIQINTPEIQNEVNNYMKRLDEEYGHIDLSRTPVGLMQGFDVGEQCVFLLRSEQNLAKIWRRGIIRAFLGDRKRSGQGQSIDPRHMKQVHPDSEYEIQDRDFGLIVPIKRKDMLQIQPAASYRRDGDKCIQVCIPGIKRSTDTWKKATDYCEQVLRRHHGNIFLKLEKELPSSQPDKIDADCIWMQLETPDACLPSIKHYYSMRYALLEKSYVALLNEESHYEREIKDEEDLSFVNIAIPFSIRDDTRLSTLRSSYFNDDLPVEYGKYLDAERPKDETFDAICTHVDDGPTLWFTLKEDPNESSIGSVNRAIMEKILNHDKLMSFKGVAEEGRACTVFGGSRWYRAEILSSANNKITVRHVDTGATKEYFMERMSCEIFRASIPKLALSGRLNKCIPFIEMRPDNHARLREYLTANIVGKNIKVRWENFGSLRQMLISVILEDTQTDLKSTLLNLDLIVESQTIVEELPYYIAQCLEIIQQSEFSAFGHQFILNKYYPVIIADFVEENYLYLQLTKFDKTSGPEEWEINGTVEIFRNDEDYINNHTRTFNRAKTYPLGSSCLAKWNNEWFRGIVVDIIVPHQKFRVFFVDWGNSDEVTIENMLILPDTLGLKGHAIFGFFVRCSNLKPARKKVWDQKLRGMMKEIVDQVVQESTNLLCKFKSSSNPYDVELWIADERQQPVKLLFKELIDNRELETC